MLCVVAQKTALLDSPKRSMHEPPVSPAGSGLASARQVRYFSSYLGAVGLLFVFLGYRGLSVKGVLPAQWFGWPLVLLAIWMFAKPQTHAFRERVGRLITLISS